jgi:hypothetical protein
LNKLCKKSAAHQFENFTLPGLFREYYCFYTKRNRRALMWVVVVVVVLVVVLVVVVVVGCIWL